MFEEMQKSQNIFVGSKNPDNLLNFDMLLKHVHGEIDNPIQSLAIEACINESSLFRDAKEGILSFIDNEGPEALTALLEKGVMESFDELMLQIVDNELLKF